MDAAFHERDTHVTAKCNVCFEGVNAAGGATEVRHTAIGGNGKRPQCMAINVQSPAFKNAGLWTKSIIRFHPEEELR